MNYEKLSEILYPNVKISLDEFLKNQKTRTLPPMSEVMRFAPSPTGFFHIGGLFSALISRLATKKTNGVFYLRIEDTDDKREIQGASVLIYDCLKRMHVLPDEGYMGEGCEKGEFGPYIQSLRLHLYDIFAKEIVKRGRAFPCFCESAISKEEVLKRREEMLNQEDEILEKDICRNLTLQQIEENLKQGKAFALRLLSKGDPNKTFEFTDRIKGKREIRENAKDIVLVKSNGIPPYAFAHVVDDTLMGTTTVVRGEEWYPSLAAHLEIFEALGLRAPNYAHTPVTCKIDDETQNKRKLSKRKDPEANAYFYIEQGYIPEALIEYLVNLLNSDFEQWKTQNPDLTVWDFDFKISKIGTNNPMFDIVKLNDVSKNYISKIPAASLFEMLKDYTFEFDKPFYEYIVTNAEYVIKVLNIDRDCAKPRKDIINLGEIKNYFSYMFNDDLKGYETNEIDIEKAKAVVSEYINVIDINDDKQAWFEKIKQMSLKLGYAVDNKAYKQNPSAFLGNVSDVCMYIRLAVTAQKNSPDLYSIISILGKDKVMSRLQQFIF